MDLHALVLDEHPLLNWDDACFGGSLDDLRANFEHQLMFERVVMTADGFLPVCPICEQPILNGTLCETFLNMGDMRAVPDEVKGGIFSRENCVLVHNGKCSQDASTQDGQVKCMMHLIQHEGLEDILEWLKLFEQRLGGSQVKDALQTLLNLIGDICYGISP